MRAIGTATAGVASAFPAQAKSGDFALEIAALPIGSVGAPPLWMWRAGSVALLACVGGCRLAFAGGGAARAAGTAFRRTGAGMTAMRGWGTGLFRIIRDVPTGPLELDRWRRDQLFQRPSALLTRTQRLRAEGLNLFYTPTTASALILVQRHGKLPLFREIARRLLVPQLAAASRRYDPACGMAPAPGSRSRNQSGHRERQPMRAVVPQGERIIEDTFTFSVAELPSSGIGIRQPSPWGFLTDRGSLEAPRFYS